MKRNAAHLIIAAIDPGLSGACAILNERLDCAAFDLPVMGDGTKKVINGTSLSRRLVEENVEFAVIEQAQAMPGQGVSSMFRFGTAYGQVLGVVQSLSIPHHIVPAAKWKRAMGLSPDKELSRRRAIEYLPAASRLFERKKDHGRAEAALLALYWLRQLQREDMAA